MEKHSDINIVIEDYRSLTPTQWQDFKREIFARAHRERTELIRAQLRALTGWLDRAVEMALRAVFTPKLPASPSHCD